MSLQEAQARLASAAKDLNLRVPEGQVTALFTAATTALSGATPEKVVQLTALLQGFSNPNLSDLKSITEKAYASVLVEKLLRVKLGSVNVSTATSHIRLGSME